MAGGVIDNQEIPFDIGSVFNDLDPEPPKASNLFRFWLNRETGLEIDFAYTRQPLARQDLQELVGKIPIHTTIVVPYETAKDLIYKMMNVLASVEQDATPQ